MKKGKRKQSTINHMKRLQKLYNLIGEKGLNSTNNQDQKTPNEVEEAPPE